VRYDDALIGEHIFHHAKTERKAKIQPYRFEAGLREGIRMILEAHEAPPEIYLRYGLDEPSLKATGVLRRH
jgi:hypothetical protein